jgi:hypothetical protein
MFLEFKSKGKQAKKKVPDRERDSANEAKKTSIT